MNSTPQFEIIPVADVSKIGDRSTWITEGRVHTHPGIPGWEIRNHGKGFRIYGLTDGITEYITGAATWDAAIAAIRYMHGA
jgi:hypothetical protein